MSDRLGEVGDELALVVRHGQRVVDRLLDLDAAGGELGVGETPTTERLGLEPVRQRSALDRLAVVLGDVGLRALAAAAASAAASTRRCDEGQPRPHGREGNH